MSIKYGILNLLLILVIFLISVKAYEAWISPLEFIQDQKEIDKQELKAEPLPIKLASKEVIPMTSYITIAEKNMFNPERKDFPIQTTPGLPVKPTTRPQIILYGVTISGDYQSASIVQVGRPLQKGERETFTIKLGDRIGEYRVTRILPDRVTFESDGDSFDALLYDPKTPKKRIAIRTETSPPAVTSRQPIPTPTSPVPSTASPPTTTTREATSSAPIGVPTQERIISPMPTSPTTPSPPSTGIRRRRVVYPPAQIPPPTPEEMNED